MPSPPASPATASPAASASPAPLSDIELAARILGHLDQMFADPDLRQPDPATLNVLRGQPYPYQPRTAAEVYLSPAEVAETLGLARKAKFHLQGRKRYAWGLNNPTPPARPLSAFALARRKLQQARETIPGFEADKWFRRPFVLLCLYFAGDKRFEQVHPSYSLDKGIGIFGPTGPGKTTLLELFTSNPRASFDIVGATDLVSACLDPKTGGEGALDKFVRRPIMLDDIGEEPANVRRPYGDKEEQHLTPFASFVSKRDRADRRGLVAPGSFHFTTNLPFRYDPANPGGLTEHDDTLESLYEARAASRLLGLVNFIAFPPDAPDRRQTRRNSFFANPQPTNPN